MYFVLSQFMHSFVPTKIPIYKLGLLFHEIPKHIQVENDLFLYNEHPPQYPHNSSNLQHLL